MRVYFVATYDSFIKPIVAELASKGLDVELDNTFNKAKALGADVIWCDWADSNAFEVQNLPFRGKKILRIHAYEVYELDIYSHINPDAFDHIVFVNKSKADYFEQILGRPVTNSIVLPNYIDTDRFVIPEGKETNKNVAVAGYICRKKGIGEFLLIASSFPNHQFHWIGDFQESDVVEYIKDGTPSNVTFYKSIDNSLMPEFLKDKTYYLNLSLRESFGVGIMEAMACGLKPIIRNWVGADYWYNEGWLWAGISDIEELLNEDVKPEEYREHVLLNADKYELANTIFEMVITPKDQKQWDTLTVAIVKSREEYLPKLLQSLKIQSCLSHYDFDVQILDNMDKQYSIGKAFNMLADECKTDLIMYLGDDDWLDECYIENCMNHYELRKQMYPEPIGFVTSCLYIENEMGEVFPCSKMPTGFWKAEYIRNRRFDETLPQQVDSEFVDRVREAEDAGEPTTVLQIESEFGYYYRQHGKNVSGQKITDAVRNGEGLKNANG